MLTRNRTTNHTATSTLKIHQFIIPPKSKATSRKHRRAAQLRTKIAALKRQLAKVLGVTAPLK
jgi:hypothetical protein